MLVSVWVKGLYSGPSQNIKKDLDEVVVGVKICLYYYPTYIITQKSKL